MATLHLAAIFLRPGDAILWGYPELEEVEVRAIHNADPVVGKLRVETSIGDLRISCLTKLHIIVGGRA